MTFYSHTDFKAQLKYSKGPEPLNWLFLPGGPGFGSESLDNLAEQLSLPGKSWYMDFPNDGSNQISANQHFEGWSDGLIDLLSHFENPIIVAHSFSGMLVLSNKKLENYLYGLVLLNTAPNNTWLHQIEKQAKQYDLPDISEIATQYEKNKNNDTFKALTIACAPYFFSPESLDKGMKLLEILPYSNESYDWATTMFHPRFTNAFIPQTIPTLVVGGEIDHITPFDLFMSDERWQRSNIQLKLIKNEGHFPWLNSGENLQNIFYKYIESMNLCPI
ncbi:alpha/beta hydrolase [Marivirga sp.]|uniref:alpha/beta fold hydrolase n=1 Tax=Marivirga sp. TaxID=2018662 RepID=UPI0025E8620B|nr:alpha/beta hydrolase [Marivirga sp.]